MARRRETGSLAPARRQAMLSELARIDEHEKLLRETKLIQVLRYWEEGLTDEEMAALLGVARVTVIRMRREGEELRDQARDGRNSDDPVGRRESSALG